METAWKYIIEEEPHHYYCILCGHDIICCHKVRDHLSGRCHERSLDLNEDHIVRNGPNHYYCHLCYCHIYGYTNVRGHLKGATHMDNLNSWTTSEDDLSDSDLSNDNLGYQVMRSIDFLTGDNQIMQHTCNLCNVLLNGRAMIDAHLSSWQHQDALRINGHTILNKGNCAYYCTLCKCSLDTTSMYNHIQGGDHQNRIRL